MAFPFGTYSGFFAGTPESGSNTGSMLVDTCQDSHGRPVNDSLLTISHFDESGLMPVSGSASSGSNWGTASDFILRGTRPGTMGHVITGIPSASSSMLDLIAGTNPSRPDIVPLTLLQDLYDLPRMLRDVGKLLRTPRRLLNDREVANQYLGAKFGWLPLVDDAHKLLNVQSYIHRRKSEIDRLYSQGGLKRRYHLGQWDAADQSVIPFESYHMLGASGRRSRTTHADRWGTIRWKPTTTPGHTPTDADRIKLARQVVLGMTSSATIKGLWDLVPWSWIVDWFTNAANFAIANANTIPATHNGACIMTHTRTEYQYEVTAMTSGYTGGGGSASYETKERFVGSASASVHIPYLNGDRLKILGALFVQRFKG